MGRFELLLIPGLVAIVVVYLQVHQSFAVQQLQLLNDNLDPPQPPHQQLSSNMPSLSSTATIPPDGPFARRDGCPPLFSDPITDNDSDKSQYSRTNSTSSSSCERIGMCAIMKNEEAYLEEWVDYYTALGFDRFILYDNSPDFELQHWPYWKRASNATKQRITLIHFPGGSRQQEAYLDCGKRLYYKEHLTWAAYFDTDEFLVLKQHDHVVDFLQEYLPSDPGGALALNWFMFGTSDEVLYEPRPVTQRFVYRDEKVNEHVKSIGRLRDVNLERRNHVHFPHLLPRGNLVQPPDNRTKIIKRDTAGNYVPVAFNVGGPTDVAVLHHYRTKSRKEYIQKTARGRADMGTAAVNMTLLQKEAQNLSPGKVYDDAAWKAMKKFLPRYAAFDDWKQ